MYGYNIIVFVKLIDYLSTSKCAYMQERDWRPLLFPYNFDW